MMSLGFAPSGSHTNVSGIWSHLSKCWSSWVCAVTEGYEGVNGPDVAKDHVDICGLLRAVTWIHVNIHESGRAGSISHGRASPSKGHSTAMQEVVCRRASPVPFMPLYKLIKNKNFSKIILSFSAFKYNNKTRKKIIRHESSKWTVLKLEIHLNSPVVKLIIHTTEQEHMKNEIAHLYWWLCSSSTQFMKLRKHYSIFKLTKRKLIKIRKP